MKHANLEAILVSPIISEKSTLSAEKHNRIAFRVRKSATKLQVKRATEFFFKVEVEAVQILNVKGKSKRFGKHVGKRSEWKKAYIKLKPGYDIDFATA